MNDALWAQQAEVTEQYLYLALAKRATGKNKETLLRIAEDEQRHAAFWKKLTKKDCKPNMWLVRWYVFAAALFGITFAIKLRESGARRVKLRYPGVHNVNALIEARQRHEEELINLLQDDRITYASSVALGLNDGLIELTGVLAGLTFALKDSHIVSIAGSVTGVAAALSMAASGYFASKEEHGKNPVRAAIYVGVTYLLVVGILIMPFILLKNVYLALGITLLFGVMLIAMYTFYLATAKNDSFRKRFVEMVSISLGVATVSFVVGLMLNKAFGLSP